jgi:hypothetical protein
MIHMRFIEVAQGSMGEVGDDLPRLAAGRPPAPPAAEPEEDLEIDEDFLRRVRDA